MDIMIVTTARIVDISGYARRKRDNEMSAIEQIVNKPIKEMTAIEYLIYEKYIQWNQNGRPKDPRNDKAGHDAIQAAAELTAMQARFEKQAEYPECLRKAITELEKLKLSSPDFTQAERARMAGKIEGLKLALGYFEEMNK